MASDKDTGTVVAWRHGWAGCKGPFWSGRNAFQEIGGEHRIEPDPRESPNETLKLLHWLIAEHDHVSYCFDARGWRVQVVRPGESEPFECELVHDVVLPICGVELGHAVVELALKIKNL